MKKFLLIILIFSMLYTTGCWDMVDINDRVYPYSIGYDPDPSGEQPYIISYTYPNINAIGKNASSEDRVYLISTPAKSAFDAAQRLTTRMSQPLYLKHLKVMVLSEEVSKNEKLVREIADGIKRDFVTNKNVQMAVSKENVKNLLEASLIKNKQARVEGLFYGMLINEQNSTLFSSKTLNDFIEETDISGSSIIPLVMQGKEEIIFSGGAIFKGYKLIGYLDPLDIKRIKYLNNNVKEDDVDIDYKGDNLSLLIIKNKSKKSLIGKEDIKIKFDVEVEAYIHSYIKDYNKEIEDEKVLKDMQEAVAQYLNTEIKKTITKVQKEYEVDAFFIGDYLRKYHNDLWKQIENNWQEIYPDIEIESEVKVIIRRRGLSK